MYSLSSDGVHVVKFISSLARRGNQDIVASSSSLCANHSLSDAEKEKSIVFVLLV